MDFKMFTFTGLNVSVLLDVGTTCHGSGGDQEARFCRHKHSFLSKASSGFTLSSLNGVTAAVTTVTHADSHSGLSPGSRLHNRRILLYKLEHRRMRRR